MAARSSWRPCLARNRWRLSRSRPGVSRRHLQDTGARQRRDRQRSDQAKGFVGAAPFPTSSFMKHLFSVSTKPAAGRASSTLFPRARRHVALARLQTGLRVACLPASDAPEVPTRPRVGLACEPGSRGRVCAVGATLPLHFLQGAGPSCRSRDDMIAMTLRDRGFFIRVRAVLALLRHEIGRRRVTPPLPLVF
jgi:hypothetical protein